MQVTFESIGSLVDVMCPAPRVRVTGILVGIFIVDEVMYDINILSEGMIRFMAGELCEVTVLSEFKKVL